MQDSVSQTDISFLHLWVALIKMKKEGSLSHLSLFCQRLMDSSLAQTDSKLEKKSWELMCFSLHTVGQALSDCCSLSAQRSLGQGVLNFPPAQLRWKGVSANTAWKQWYCFGTDAQESAPEDINGQIHGSGSPTAYLRLSWTGKSSVFCATICILQPNRLQLQDMSTAVISIACIYSVAISSSMAFPWHQWKSHA